MQEDFTNYTPSPSNEEKADSDERIELAIRSFFAEQWPVDNESTSTNYGADFDISDPKISDMQKVQKGDFAITDLQIFQSNDPEKFAINFYVGGTEFHIAGKAAQRILELMPQDKTENS